MKIVCDSCSTKYSISDDKVRGKVFKIRCKKCSHIIVVKGTTESAAAPEAPLDGVWHLVVDGDQVGPLTDADVRGRLSRNEISSENYVWKEGFADWLRLADVPEFADVAAAPPPGNELFSDNGLAAAPAPETAPLGAVSGGFFSASSPSEPESLSAASGPSLGFSPNLSASAPDNAEATRADDDAFSAPSTMPVGDGTDLFGMGAPSAARVDSGRVRARPSNGTAAGGRHDGGRIENLTAQRSENSVLFSLSNLQSLAAPPANAKASPSPVTEGSGLIDIRAMAASTLRAPGGGGNSLFGGDSQSADNDLPTFGSFSSAAPVLLSLPSSSGPPKWVYLLIGLAAVLIILVGVAAFSILGRPVMVQQPVASAPVVAVAPPPRAGVTDDRMAAGTPTPKPMAEGDLPPRAGGEPPADKGDARSAADKAANKGSTKKLKPSKKPGGPGAGDSRPAGGGAAASPSSPPAEAEKARPAKGSLDDLLEGALNGRKSGRPRVDDDAPARKGGPVGEPPPSAGPLAKAAVVAGMNGVKSKVSACYAQYKQPGLVMVDVVIAKTGKVSNASVTGKFAGTPTGGCVEAAVKTASFPPSEGLKTPYPFTLR